MVNPDEKQPYTDEYSLQFERQLIPDLAVRLTGIQARVSNVVRLANRRRPYEAYNIPITSRDPGPDGRVGTADDPGAAVVGVAGEGAEAADPGRGLARGRPAGWSGGGGARRDHR